MLNMVTAFFLSILFIFFLMGSLEGGGYDNFDPRPPPVLYGLLIVCFLRFLRRRYGPTGGRTDGQTLL